MLRDLRPTFVYNLIGVNECASAIFWDNHRQTAPQNYGPF